MCSYALLNYTNASNAEDDGKLLGFATAATVLVLDFGAGLLVYVPWLTPTPVAALLEAPLWLTPPATTHDRYSVQVLWSAACSGPHHQRPGRGACVVDHVRRSVLADRDHGSLLCVRGRFGVEACCSGHCLTPMSTCVCCACWVCSCVVVLARNMLDCVGDTQVWHCAGVGWHETHTSCTPHGHQ